MCHGQGQVDLAACWLSWVHEGGCVRQCTAEATAPLCPSTPTHCSGWVQAFVLWNFVLSSALLLQKFVVALGLGGLLPGEMRSSCPIGVAGSTAHQQLAAPLHGRG